MHNFLQRLQYSLSRFFQGRYGIDGLFLPIVITSCVFTLLSSFRGLGLLRLLGTALLIYAVFRACSRNFTARQKELRGYLSVKNKISAEFRLRQRMYQERKLKKYFRCPVCKTWLCVPKGKGKLRISCRKCNHTFVRKS